MFTEVPPDADKIKGQDVNSVFPSKEKKGSKYIKEQNFFLAQVNLFSSICKVCSLLYKDY